MYKCGEFLHTSIWLQCVNGYKVKKGLRTSNFKEVILALVICLRVSGQGVEPRAGTLLSLMQAILHPLAAVQTILTLLV